MFLGLDLGTSGLRALLVDRQGVVIASAEQGYPVSHPHQGWSEQDPDDWIGALERTVNALRESHPSAFATLQAIGVAGQMHGATLLDKNDKILRPCILWNDTRSHVEAATFDADPLFRDISGNIVFPGFTAPKLAWVQKHEPEVFAKIARVLLPAAYLNFWLTGEFVSDMSDTSGTSWLSVGGRTWSAGLLEKTNMTPDQMPRLVEGCEIAGTLRAELAAAWGVASSVSVVGGAGDNAAAACGVGALNEGDGFVSLGTSGVILAAKSQFSPNAETAVHTFCHAIPDRWYQMGVTLAATDSLNWLAGVLETSPEKLTASLENEITEPGSIRFLPYLSGERTPHNDSAIRGALIGLDISSDRQDLTRAVLEGVCFALRDSLDALRSTGTSLDRLLAIGGGTGSSYWIELLATILNMPIDLPDASEFGAALGACRLAICGKTDTNPLEVMAKPVIAKTIEPRADLVLAYESAYQKFRETYPAIKAIQ